MLVGLESANKQKDKTTSEDYISEMQSNFLEGEPIVDFDYYYNFAKSVIPTITVEEVSALAKQYLNRKNMVIVVQGPSEGVKHITKEEAIAIMDKVENANLEPYKDQSAEAALITEDLKGSKIISTKKLPQFDAEEWVLENGAKVVFRKADYEKDQVQVASYSKGGTSLYDVDKLASAMVTDQFIGAYGLGDYDAITLRKLLTGKQAQAGVSISGLSESVGGASTPKDFETLMQLIYLRFEKPRFDKEVHQTMMTLEQWLMLADMMNTADTTDLQAEEVTVTWIQVALLVYLAGILLFALRNGYSLLKLYQRQSDTGTGLMPVHLIEALEDGFHIGRRNVAAGIEDGQTVVLFRL